MSNGLRGFAIHSADPQASPGLAALRAERDAFPAFAAAAHSLPESDPESAARRHLQLALSSDSMPGLTAPAVEGAASEFRILGTENVALTGTRTVKFRQTLHKIPVYGSLVTVELDESGEMLALNTALGTPSGVNPVAAISPAQAVERVQALARNTGAIPAPRLVYYFAGEHGGWHLAYLMEDVENRGPRGEAREGRAGGYVSLLADYVVDAHTGALLAELPRTPNVDVHADSEATLAPASLAPSGASEAETAPESAGAQPGPAEEHAPDELDRVRRFRCMRTDGGIRLHDDALNVHTYDLGFGDVIAGPLPGAYVGNPPTWARAAVSAHANASEVAQFLQKVLQRPGVDGRGGPLVSSVNCVVRAESPDGREWANAAWYKDQMVYGQRVVGGVLRSYAAGLDVVAHEVFHGVTSATARLQYLNETGALNESYSDIFGVIVSNIDREIPEWDWRLGEDTEGTGIPLRDLRDPARHGQPAHMNDYRQMPPSRDAGGVHYNSGIHNRAACLILTAVGESGQPLFTPASAAALFYLALTQYLSRTSTFSDSRNALLLVARTLFRNDPPELREAKLAAISSGFDQVGIR